MTSLRLWLLDEKAGAAAGGQIATYNFDTQLEAAARRSSASATIRSKSSLHVGTSLMSPQDWLQAHMLSCASPVSYHILYARLPLAKGATLLKSFSPAFSMSASALRISFAVGFKATLHALFKERNTTVVCLSSKASLAMWSLTSWRIGHSFVARNLVAIVTP